MNALPPIRTANSIAEDGDHWRRAVEGVNEWRGACLQSFAQAEYAVTSTLIQLQSDPARGTKIRLRYLIGQRLEDLAVAIGSEGPFAGEGKPAATSLATFRAHEPLRVHLAHGKARIALERNGHWIVIFESIRSRPAKPEPVQFVIDQATADETRRQLRADTQSLCDRLSALERKLSA